MMTLREKQWFTVKDRNYINVIKNDCNTKLTVCIKAVIGVRIHSDVLFM